MVTSLLGMRKVYWLSAFSVAVSSLPLSSVTITSSTSYPLSGSAVMVTVVVGLASWGNTATLPLALSSTVTSQVGSW